LPRESKKPIILVGFHRTGQSLARNLPTEDIMVVDFDPEVIKKLDQLNYDYVFGDVTDPEIFDQIKSYKTQLVISTSPDLEDNLMIISNFRNLKRRPGIIVRAENEKEAKIFYDSGADYVLVPHFASGEHLGRILAKNMSLATLRKLKDKDLKVL